MHTLILRSGDSALSVLFLHLCALITIFLMRSQMLSHPAVLSNCCLICRNDLFFQRLASSHQFQVAEVRFPPSLQEDFSDEQFKKFLPMAYGSVLLSCATWRACKVDYWSRLLKSFLLKISFMLDYIFETSISWNLLLLRRAEYWIRDAAAALCEVLNAH